MKTEVEHTLPNSNDENSLGYGIFFSRLTPFLKRVVDYQLSDKQIENNDISDFLAPSPQVKTIICKIKKYEQENKHQQNGRYYSLFPIYSHMVAASLLQGIFMLVLQSVIGYSGILFMDMTTNIIKDFDGETNDKIKISLLLFATILVFVIKNVIFTQVAWLNSKWKVTASTTLQYLVFMKSLRAQTKVSQEAEVKNKKGEEKKKEKSQDNPEVSNVMTIDVDKQLVQFSAITETITNIISIVILLSLLYYKIGSALFSGLYIIGITFIVHSLVTFSMVVIKLLFMTHQIVLFQKFSKVQMKWKDKRVGLSKDVIEGMKSVKYLGWEQIFMNKIEDLRSKEFQNSTITRSLDAFLSVFWGCANYVLLYFFLTDFVDKGNNLKDSNVFTIIALFGNLMGPISSLPWSISSLMKSQVSYNRIQQFMNAKEIDTTAQILNTQENINSTIENESNSTAAITIVDMKFQWPSQEGIKSIQSQNEKEESFFELKELNNQSKFLLHIQSLKIAKGNLAVVVGKIGAGKTAFLQAILNELDSQHQSHDQSVFLGTQHSHFIDNEDKIILNGSTAYVSQNHWLQNKSVKDNILFGQPYEEEWYQTVVNVSDLRVDLDSFQQGDEKIIGPGGGNLSGGQRQRVSFGRALYSKKDIYLFDDIFSSLDAHVAEKIFSIAILDLLIKQLNKTVVLVTSHFGIFSNKGKINQVILLDNGKIVTDEDSVEEFILSGMSQQQKEQEAKRKADQFQMNQEILVAEENEDEAEEEKEDKQTAVAVAVAKQQIAQEQLTQSKVDASNQEQNEQREKGGIKAETFITYFNTMGIPLLLVFLTSNFCMEFSQMFIDFWLKDQSHPKVEGYDSPSLMTLINTYGGSFKGAFLLLIILNFTITGIRGISYCLCSLKSSKKIFLKLNKSLIYSKMEFFDINPVGRIINRLSNDISCIDDYLPWSCHIFLENLAFSVGYPLGVMIQFPQLAVIAAIAASMIYFVQKLFRVANREVKRLNSVNSGKVLTIICETCQGINVIRSFNKEQHMLTEYLHKLNEYINTFLLTQGIQIWMSIRLLLISNIIFGCVGLVSALLIIFDIKFDYSAISMCLTYSLLLSNRFSSLIQYLCNVEQSSISVERVRQYFSNQSEEPLMNHAYAKEQSFLQQKITQDAEYSQLQDTSQMQEDIEQNTNDISIEFRNVYITYDKVTHQKLTQHSSEVQFALNNINLSIKKGEKVAFCGRTGSGKTSILNTLFGMYPIQFGAIFVKGKSINSYSLRELRQQMSIIPQFGFLYKASLLQNLDPECQFPRSIVEDKVNATNLRIRNNNVQNNEQDDINPPDNLDFEIDDGGDNLSNGEKQIVNFLRVVLRESEIVCLDEASSNMDPKTDALLHEKIFEYAENKTLIVITHRLENIERFDRVVVMDKGKVVESGHVKTLRQIKGGFFNRLIKNEY